MGGGSFFFVSLWRLLLRERPDIVVVTPPHLPGFMRYSATRLVMAALNIKLAEGQQIKPNGPEPLSLTIFEAN